ncbi:16S rRNA (uracil(1498)-N(3))-methyltransferase [Albimonas sp. CAU 1670]|uniref:16S rRNA (uracil(1498)-N(3))-methyltransferase n=1 Tax=Albimonas sp. CAU 1670 TaxID=3032599 RepID=UPI0023DA272C|nr:16S rRNA (uracil(1498)-N(3))-methyltransferase [Albimonas sp. CAU 1670]MDF2231452.1 16S rRNA (uracil(1498)-N(3))-methyltransferase [Albimonas sp. CAU 1670]
MAEKAAKVRLCVTGELSPGAVLEPSREQAHYLFNVMRLTPGDTLLVFNGRDGEWRAEVSEASRKGGALTCVERTRPQTRPRDLWLLFAPVKKARTDFIVEKACELGCAALRPVFTRRTNAERLRPDRLQAHMVEAAEQCGFLSVPELMEAERLDRVLDAWDPARRLLFCDERRDAPPITQALAAHAPAPGADAGPWAVLIGPEGGFDEAESERLRAAPYVTPVSLGPRILRADTAAASALTIWQAALGDWNGTEGATA